MKFRNSLRANIDVFISLFSKTGFCLRFAYRIQIPVFWATDNSVHTKKYVDDNPKNTPKIKRKKHLLIYNASDNNNKKVRPNPKTQIFDYKQKITKRSTQKTPTWRSRNIHGLSVELYWACNKASIRNWWFQSFFFRIFSSFEFFCLTK